MGTGTAIDEKAFDEIMGGTGLASGPYGLEAKELRELLEFYEAHRLEEAPLIRVKVEIDPSIPDGEIHVKDNGKEVGRIVNAVVPSGEIKVFNGEDEGGPTERVAWRILQALHSNVPEDQRPMSWSDMKPEQQTRIRQAADGAIEETMLINARLTPPKRELRNQESGWVIEKAQSQPCLPEYFTGATHPAIEWSDPGDHMNAIRFARKEDAEKAARRFINPRICEHVWTV